MSIFEYKKNKRHAFTLVEVMLLLVVLSLIVASSTTVITRKHKLKPRKSIHGLYICYYESYRDASGVIHDNGKREILMSNGTVLSDRYVTGSEKCKFTIPRSSNFINVKLIGGGGAGGNANYSPVSSPRYDTGYINLVRDFPSSYSSYRVAPKITDGSTTLSYPQTNSSMGVTESYVNNKFMQNGVPLFHSSVYKKFLNDNVVKSVFPYDYAGSGQVGNSVAINAFSEGGSDYDKVLRFCSIYGSPTTDRNECFLHYIKSKGFTDTNQKATCITNVDDPTYCPDFYYEFFHPNTKTNAKVFYGGDGGIGSVFGSKSVFSGFEFETFPILGWRWKDYNNTVYTSEGLSPVCNKTIVDAGYTIDLYFCYGYTSQNLTPEYNSGTVSPGAFKPCPEGETNCRLAADGVSHLLTSDYNISYYSAGSLKTANGYAWQLFDGYEDLYNTPSFYSFYWDVTDGNHNITEIKYPDEEPRNGGFPYFGSKPGESNWEGIELYRKGNTSFDVRTKGLAKDGSTYYITGTAVEDAIGYAGESLSSTGDKAITKYDLWDLYGKARAELPTNKLPANGQSGTTSFNTSKPIACIANLAFVFKGDSPKDVMKDMLNISTNTCKNTRVPTASPGEFLYESEWALNVRLRYYSKAISYGAKGNAGGFLEFFTRSSLQNDVFAIPGKSGFARDIGSTLQNEQPTDHENGKGSLLYYNCTSATKCASTAVGGGRGGVSGIYEVPDSVLLTGKEIHNLGTNKKRIHCSYLAPNEYGCPGGYETLRIGETSKFSETASLLGLPDAPIDLTLLGKGGDAGYAIDNCWIMPQYFAIYYAHKASSGFSKLSTIDYDLEDFPNADSYRLLPEYGDINGDGNWYGSVRITKSNVDTCQSNNKFSNGKYYNEIPGTDGMPGAVVITW